jgi:transposase
MRGQPRRAEGLFYYLRREDEVPENHRLRLLEKHNRLALVGARLKASSSATGRPAMDPELRWRILLIGD